MQRDNKGKFIKQPLEEKFWSKVDIKDTEECWGWKGGLDKKGYGFLKEYDQDNNLLKTHLVHRLSFLFHYGYLTKDKVICHKCDNRKCVNPKHLFEGTQRENIIDMINKGRNATPEQKARKGEDNGSAKLTEVQVKEIRSKYKPRIHTVKMLAKEYGVSIPLIEKILSRKIWKHVI